MPTLQVRGVYQPPDEKTYRDWPAVCHSGETFLRRFYATKESLQPESRLVYVKKTNKNGSRIIAYLPPSGI